MERILKLIKSCSLLQFMMLLSLTDNSMGDVNIAATGCVYADGIAKCNFQSWTPPLMDADFGPGQLKVLFLQKLNGIIPAGVMFQDKFIY